MWVTPGHSPPLAPRISQGSGRSWTVPPACRSRYYRPKLARESRQSDKSTCARPRLLQRPYLVRGPVHLPPPARRFGGEARLETPRTLALLQTIRRPVLRQNAEPDQLRAELVADVDAVRG